MIFMLIFETKSNQNDNCYFFKNLSNKVREKASTNFLSRLRLIGYTCISRGFIHARRFFCIRVTSKGHSAIAQWRDLKTGLTKRFHIHDVFSSQLYRIFRK